ncbi:hypothetical protein GCM10028791_25610 [Echinicola sediminis]
MELETTVIGLVGLVLCILPFVLLQRSRKKKEKELHKGLNAIASSVDSELGTKDFGFEFAIGVSTNKNHILYYKKTKEEEVEEIIPIQTVENCSVNAIKRIISSKEREETIIDKLELEFLLKKKSKISLVFYNRKEGTQLNGELALIKKWESLVHQCISYTG